MLVCIRQEQVGCLLLKSKGKKNQLDGKRNWTLFRDSISVPVDVGGLGSAGAGPGLQPRAGPLT